MNYALIQDGVVVNLIWMYEGNAVEFPDAVSTMGLPVQIGDTFQDGVFLHSGEPVISAESELKEALAVLGVTDDE